MDNHKLAVIVPYRNRYAQFIAFKERITTILNENNIIFELIVIEQDCAKTFNRGKLLNIGYLYAKKLNCDYMVFHDVDMLPVDVDYSYSPYPVHLATNFISNGDFERIFFDEYFGGVTLFPMDVFEKINGFSNDYWGWGYEDTDLLFRCKINDVPLDKKVIDVKGGDNAGLYFNGKDAYIECKNEMKMEGKKTIFVSFFPDDISCDHEKYDDTFPVFTIPGFDMLISFNSYNRYNFEIYDSRKNIHYINSNIKPNYNTNVCITFDFDIKEIKMYQDGQLVDIINYKGKLYEYEESEKFYLGVNDPNKEGDQKYFKGSIGQFAIYDKILSEEEIIELSKNKFFGLTQNFGKYESAYALSLAYDAKFVRDYKLIDLTGKGNDGMINNCALVGHTSEDHRVIEIPHRRKSTFELLPHEENGFVDGGWRNITTRFNQVRYFNEVAKGHRNTLEDGITTCKFKETTFGCTENRTHVIVSI